MRHDLSFVRDHRLGDSNSDSGFESVRVEPAWAFIDSGHEVCVAVIGGRPHPLGESFQQVRLTLDTAKALLAALPDAIAEAEAKAAEFDAQARGEG